MNVFDFINNILFDKKEQPNETQDEESEFNGYMVNRWISMYSPSMSIIVNNSTNWLYSIFQTKQEYYKFLLKIIPQVRRRYIRYIKKVKIDDHDREEVDANITLLATNLELSKR